MDGGHASSDASDDQAAVQHHVERASIHALGLLLASDIVQVFVAEAEGGFLDDWQSFGSLV